MILAELMFVNGVIVVRRLLRQRKFEFTEKTELHKPLAD